MAIFGCISQDEQPQTDSDVPLIPFKVDESLVEPAYVAQELGLSFKPPLGCVPMTDSFFQSNKKYIALSIGLDTNQTDYTIHAGFMDTLHFISCIISSYTWKVPDNIHPKLYHYRTTKMRMAQWDEVEDDCYRLEQNTILKRFAFANSQVKHLKYFVVKKGKPIISVDYLVPKEEYRRKEDLIKSSVASIDFL